MVFNPYKDPSVTLGYPDPSAQFSPWYQMAINQGQAPAPYYNPFQGAYAGDQGIPVIPPPTPEDPVAEPAPVPYVAQEDDNDEQYLQAQRSKFMNNPPKAINGTFDYRDYGLPGGIGKGLTAIGKLSIDHQNKKISEGKGKGYD